MPRNTKQTFNVTLVVAIHLNWLGSSGRAEDAEPAPLFDSRPDHPWNTLHDALWLRTAGDGRVYGRDRLDVLLWANTRRLTAAPSAQAAIKQLDAFLALADPNLDNSTLKRLMMQRDLWAVFDWLANREHQSPLSARADDRAMRSQLRLKLASALQRLAIQEAEIRRLPSTYQAAVESGEFAREYEDRNWRRPFLPSRLLDADGPWVGLGTADGPVALGHLRGAAAFSRSAFTVFIKLPEGRQQTLDYLKRLRDFETPWVRDPATKGSIRSIPNPATPQFPPGTQVALLRRMLCIDTEGRLTATPMGA